MSERGFLWVRACLVGALMVLGSASAGVKTELVTGGVSRPVYVGAPPGDTNRLFIIEQHTGQIRIFDLVTRSFRPDPFLVVTNLATGNEQGLLGLAFHPQYRSNGFFYINMTARVPGGRTEIHRYTAIGDPATSDLADRSTRKEILTFAQPESNHNGGWIDFGPDGYLYISTGDGGGGFDQHPPFGNAQNRANLLGKILRIDVDSGDPYAVPESNPFQGDATFRGEIWAFGLRNPWRCSFDPETGNLWIGDVGQSRQEEIDVIPAGIGGLNFGWRPREGTIHTPSPVPASEQPVTPATEPVVTYGRDLGFSVTGGYVYRGSAVPELFGKYIYGDYGSGRYWALTPDATGTNGTAVPITGLSEARNPSAFGVDGRGELYICDHGDGQIYRIVTDLVPPRISASAIIDGSFVFSFEAEPARDYIVEARSPVVGGGQWTQLSNFPAAPTNRTISVTQPLTGTEQYFRLRLP